MQQVEQLGLGRTVAPDGVAFTFHVDGGAAEDREPDGGHSRGNEEHCQAELTNGAAARNACDEHADEGAPGDPPGPVEDGPAGQEAAGRAVGGLGGAARHLEESGEVGADRAGDEVQHRHRGAQNEYEDRQERGEHHVGVRQVLNAPAHARHSGQQEGQRQHQHNTDDNPLTRVFDQPRRLQPCANLQCTKAERAGGAEHRRENCEYVDDSSQPAAGELLADQRDECLAEQLLATDAEGRVRNGQADDGVHGPGMERPVEHGGGHRGHHFVFPVAGHAVTVEGERLGGAVEHEADAHAGGEHHRYPADGVELRLLLVTAKFDAPEVAESDHENEHDEHRAEQHEGPAEVRDDEIEC